jgi:hypothetical protein
MEKNLGCIFILIVITIMEYVFISYPLDIADADIFFY